MWGRGAIGRGDTGESLLARRWLGEEECGRRRSGLVSVTARVLRQERGRRGDESGGGSADDEEGQRRNLWVGGLPRSALLGSWVVGWLVGAMNGLDTWRDNGLDADRFRQTARETEFI